MGQVRWDAIEGLRGTVTQLRSPASPGDTDTLFNLYFF